MNTTTTQSPPRAPEGRSGPAILPMLAIGVVVVAALAALLISVFRTEDTADDPFDEAVATVGGTSLVALPEDGGDPAVGQPAPTLRGEDPKGETVTAPTTGKATVVLFLAHWCPHCQAEVPVVQDWIEAGQKPDGVDLVGVATAMNAARTNYPTSEWLEKEGWTLPIIADGDSQAMDAYGLSAFPFWVAVGPDGQVVKRVTGELTVDQINALFAEAAAG
jgi:cytochrome c biogenesis protein CcmG/thiol:disulfide interchange protein DsbE